MATKKFSQFVDGGSLETGDIVVGLRAGVNTQFDATIVPVSPVQQLNGVNFFDGSEITSNNVLTFDGQEKVVLNGNDASMQIEVDSSLSGSPNEAFFKARRGDDTNGFAGMRIGTNTPTVDHWDIGIRPGSNDLQWYDVVNGANRLAISSTTGQLNVPSLTASALVATDASKNLGNASVGSTLTFSGGSLTTNALSGDVTSPANSFVTTIATGAVTFSKIQPVAANSLFGNPTGSTATGQAVTLGATLTFSGADLRTTALTGDVATAANSFATTIQPGVVTYGKIQNVSASRIIGNPTGSTASAQEISLGSALAFSGSALNVAALGITNSMIANGTIDLTTKVTGILPIANGGTNASSQISNSLCYFNGVSITTSTDIYRSGTGLLTLSATGAVVAPTGNTQFNLSTTDTNSKRIMLTGQEWYQTGGGTTSTEGIGFVLGKNRTGDRELWLIDSLQSAKNTSNPTMRFVISASGTAVSMDSVSTDGSTFLPIDFGSSSSNSRLFGATTTITGATSLILSSPGFSYDGNIFKTYTSGNSGDARFCGAYVGTKGSTTATNFYGLAIDKFGVETAFLGINKNSATNQVPASAMYLSTYTSGGIWTIGRGGSNMLPSFADLLGDGAGNVSLGNGKLNMLIDAVQFYTPGKGVINATGSNGLTGSFTFVAGSATVSNTSIGANDHVILTYYTISGTPGIMSVSSITAGVGFTVTSSAGGLDVSTVKYTIQRSS